MNSKFRFQAWLLCISCLLSSCWGKQKDSKNTTDFGFFKTSDAGQACVNTNVSQWELNASFLHSFLSCASNKSVDGDETLSGLQNLLAKLDESKMQKLLDFVLTVDPKGATHEERYPYLLAATTLLDRGLVDGKVAGLNLAGERLGSLQDFLVTLDASKTKDILSTWSRSGHLAEVLNEFGAFVDLLEDNSLETATHELLSGNTLKPEFLYLSRRLLKEDLLFTNLSDVLAKKSARPLSPAEQLTLLAPYREALTASDTQALTVIEPAEKTETTALAELAKQHEQYTPSELQGLSSLLLSYWKSYSKLSEEERKSLDIRLSDAMNGLFGQAAHSAKWSLALLRDATTLKAKDLDRTSYALEQLLQEGSNISLEAIRAKAGSSKLTYQLQTLLSKGGKIPSCPIFDQPLINGDAGYQDFVNALTAISRPHSGCGDRIPLVAAIESFTGATITSVCANQEVCLQEIVPLASSQELWDSKEIDPLLTQKLIRDSLQHLHTLTTQDPYALYNLQLARDRVDSSFLRDLQVRIEKSSDWSLAGLASLDESLNTDYSSTLQKDFLEKLLTYRIETLASRSAQFADLAPEQSAEINASTEGRSSRIFAGLYSDGPLEQILARKFDISNFPFSPEEQDLKRYLESHPSIWSRITYRAKQADGIFRSPTNGGLSGETQLSFSGAGSSLRSYLAFDATPNSPLKPVISGTTAQRMIQPYQATRTFSDDTQGYSAWALWNQHYANGPLMVKDVPAELSQKLQDWFAITFIPTVSADSFWPELETGSQGVPSESLVADFYDVVPYSSEEARLLTSYYIKQYQKLGPSLPDSAAIAFGKSSAPTSDTSAIADPIRGFFNTSYLVKDDFEALYSVYAKYFPKVLRNSVKMSELKNSILPNFTDFQTQQSTWSFPEIAQVNDVTRLVDDTESPYSILSSIDLLTYSKPQSKFIPQSVVGFAGKLCRSKTKDPVNATVWVETATACPFDFQGATEEEAYNKFRAYLSEQAIQSFCPLLTSDDFGPRMIWSQRLGLTLDDQSLCKTNARILETYRFPTWHSSRVLNDVFTMGRKASLKSGIAQIPGGLRYYKLKNKGFTGEHLASTWLQQGKGVWSERNALDQRRRQFFAGGFWVGAPKLLDSYLNLLSQHLDPFSWRTVLIAHGERNEQGEVKDTLRDIIRLVTSEQRLAAAADESAITLGLRIFDKIAENAEFRSFIATSLTDLNSSSAYDLYSNEVPLALVQLFPPDVNAFDWNDLGLRFAKNLGQHSTLLSWQVIGESFNPSEINRFLATSHEALGTVVELSDRVSLVTKLSAEATHVGTLYLPSEATYLTEKFEALAQTWSQVFLGQRFRSDWSTLVTKLEVPIFGLDGRETLTGASMTESLINAAIQRGPALLSKIQQAGEFAETLFWRNWADSFLATIEAEGEGASAMANFIAQKRFDFSEGKLWMDLIHPSDLQNKAILALEVVDSIPENIWRMAIEEGTEISSRLVKALAYLRSHLIWKVDPDHNAFRIALDQLFELSQDQDLRDKQLELITLWLKGEDSPDNQNGIKK